ncbi:MAG: glycosyltransferase family 4 protein, partial [Pseudomonadota bacterium]
DDVRPYLRKAWLFVLSSVSEGFPQVILEAMSCGLPVVATTAGGIPEIVEDEVNGLLAPPCSPESLAIAMAKILSNEKMRKTMSEKARKTAVENYSLDHVVRMTEINILAAIRKNKRPN